MLIGIVVAGLVVVGLYRANRVLRERPQLNAVLGGFMVLGSVLHGAAGASPHDARFEEMGYVVTAPCALDREVDGAEIRFRGVGAAYVAQYVPLPADAKVDLEQFARAALEGLVPKSANETVHVVHCAGLEGREIKAKGTFPEKSLTVRVRVFATAGHGLVLAAAGDDPEVEAFFKSLRPIAKP